MGILRIEVDGGPATVDQLAHQAIVNYGHFTAMQVRHGAVRGLGLHLSRLDSATRELFGSGLDGELVRAHVRHALGAGFDDALLTGPGGVIAEGGIANIGFFDGDAVVWPSAPLLAGITMQLVIRALEERGVPSRHDQVHIAGLRSFRSVFVTNSLGVAPVGQVDDQVLAADAAFGQLVGGAYESMPWDPI